MDVCAGEQAILRAIAARKNSCHFFCEVLTNSFHIGVIHDSDTDDLNSD